MAAPGARNLTGEVAGRWPRRRFLRWTGAAVAVTVPGSAALAGCAGRRRIASGPRPVRGALVNLPPPRLVGTVSLEGALAARHSVRSFSAGEPSLSDVGQLLWAAQGITHGGHLRTAPSAGALYALELYAATATRTLRYVPAGHRAEEWAPRDHRPDLAAAADRPPALVEATLVVVLTVTPSRLAAKYGHRAERFADLEAGHAAQGLLLQATSLGLGAVTIGAFRDDAVTSVLALPVGESARYLIAVGRPSGG